MIKKTIKHIVIYGGVNAIQSLVPFLMLPILTLHLTSSDYGKLSLIETSILFVTTIVSLNINSAISVSYFKIETNQLKHYISNAFFLSLLSFGIILIIFFSFSRWLSFFFEISESLIIFIPIFALLRVSGQVLLGIYQVSGQSVKFFTFSITQTVIDFGASYVFVVFYKLKYIGRLGGTYVAYLLCSILALILLYKASLLTKPAFKYTKNILNFGIPLIFHSIAGTVMIMANRYFIYYYYGGDQVGYFTSAYQMASLMLLVGISVNQAWSPTAYQMISKKIKLNFILDKTLFVFIFLILCALVLYLMEDVIYDIFVNEKFHSSIKYYPLLLTGFMFQSLYFISAAPLFVLEKIKILTSITIVGASINLTLNYLFINYFGIIGIAYASALTWMIFFLLVSYKSYTLVSNESV